MRVALCPTFSSHPHIENLWREVRWIVPWVRGRELGMRKKGVMNSGHGPKDDQKSFTLVTKLGWTRLGG